MRSKLASWPRWRRSSFEGKNWTISPIWKKGLHNKCHHHHQSWSCFPEAPVISTPTTLEVQLKRADLLGWKWTVVVSFHLLFVEDASVFRTGNGWVGMKRKRQSGERKSLTTKFLFPVSIWCLPSLFSDYGQNDPHEEEERFCLTFHWHGRFKMVPH